MCTHLTMPPLQNRPKTPLTSAFGLIRKGRLYASRRLATLLCASFTTAICWLVFLLSLNIDIFSSLTVWYSKNGSPLFVARALAASLPVKESPLLNIPTNRCPFRKCNSRRKNESMPHTLHREHSRLWLMASIMGLIMAASTKPPMAKNKTSVELHKVCTINPGLRGSRHVCGST